MKSSMNPIVRTLTVVIATILAAATLAACAGPTASPTPATTPTPTTVPLSGKIIIDGSSTVYPITQAIAEEFSGMYSDVQIPVAFAGTGGGFSKFAKGEIDINDASRPIKEKEIQACKDGEIEYTFFKVAYDGITVVVNKENDWANDITVEELNAIWKPDSTVMKWSDVRAGWPDQPIGLYGPGTASGTLDYFTEEITGESGAVRADYTPSEDDNVLVQGIAGDKYSLGFFGFSYFEENKDKLKALAIDEGKGAVAPTFEAIKDGSYSPLSRPLFIYVNNASLERPEVLAFVQFYLAQAPGIVGEVGYVPLTDEEYAAEKAKIA